MRLPNVWRFFSIFFILKSATTLKNDIELKKEATQKKRLKVSEMLKGYNKISPSEIKKHRTSLRESSEVLT